MTADATPRRALPEKGGRRGRGLTLAGVVLLLLGLGALGWSGYELFWKPSVDPAVTTSLTAELRQEWQAGPTASGKEAEVARPMPGEAVALLRVPKLGESFEHVVLAGTDGTSLDRGIGWYEGTSAPGEVGNFAVSGRGVVTGPLARITDLVASDQVLVETREAVYTYELTNNPAETIVKDTDTWVIQPVPGKPEVRPTESLITLTTSHDLIRTDARTVAFGTLVSTQDK